jgi:hypothetical protein
VVSVDNGGKLFERIKIGAPVECDKRYRNPLTLRAAAFSEFLPTPRKTPGPGGSPHRTGWLSFVTFLCHQRKVSIKAGIPIISIEKPKIRF